jgi:hypothetical protein
VRYNSPEWGYAVLGIAGSATVGMLMPINALLFGSIISDFYLTGG